MKRITCVATGPSLTQEQVSHAYKISDCVIAVNDAYRLVPMQGKGAVLYGADPRWWTHHWPHIQENWVGECHTQNLNWLPPDLEKIGHTKVWAIDTRAGGLSTNPEKLHGGGNSGFQALNIAALLADADAEIYLIGYDMNVNKGIHFFGSHPKGWGQGHYSRYVAAFRGIKDGRIINCTPGSSLDWFPAASITDY
jgi:hypothetical protein